MTLHDAIRKLRLLANVKQSRGFTVAEARAAAEMTRKLREEFKLNESSIRLRPVCEVSWDAWETLALEFGLVLRKFGKRASFSVVNGQHVVTIKGDTAEWLAQKVSNHQSTTIRKDVGVESLRHYLKSVVVREYALFTRRVQHSRSPD
jgi:hypothetical protein